LGKVLAAELDRMRKEHAIVGDVRSLGLFSTIELVQDRVTRQPVDTAVMNRIKAQLKADGLTTFVNKNMVFACPPLVITEAQLRDGLGIIERAIARVQESG
jgi:taurine--2-oxoglutarate transaminase